MYLSETVGAAVAHFQLNNRECSDIFLITTRHSAVAWRMSFANEKGYMFYEASEDRIRPCGGHTVAGHQGLFPGRKI